jgi:hypothetical protein
MLKRLIITMGMVLALAACLATVATAGVPFPATSTCNCTITQFPTRLSCITSWDPYVVRLTPAGSTASPLFDRVSCTVRVRDAQNVIVPGALVSFSEQSGVVNIANGGATTSTTDAGGLATILLHAASGYGRIALCADGVQLCNLRGVSPDVNKGATPALCGIGTGSSNVSGSDITNPVCGFSVNFGSVTVGVNEGWDLNCDSNVSGPDITGLLGKGGVLQYFGDTGTLGALNSCALP